MEGKPGKFRRILSQILACTALYLLLTDLGVSISFATIVIPAVLNAKEGISLNDTEASWLGSIAFLFQPIGSIISGPIMDWLGRKRALFIVNSPHVLAFLILHFAYNKTSIFIASALLGLGTGIMEAPSITYVGEISRPSIRGILTSLSGVFPNLGILTCFFLGSIVDWKTAAIICLFIPIASMTTVFLAIATLKMLIVLFHLATAVVVVMIKITMMASLFTTVSSPWRPTYRRRLSHLFLCLCQFCFDTLVYNVYIPDTPIWLVSKGRHDDALKSLCWLRGWCKPQFVQDEYRNILRYNESNNQCLKCVSLNTGEERDIGLCSHKNSSFADKISSRAQILRGRDTLRPLKIVILCFMLSSFTALSAIRPNLVNVCRALGMNADRKWIINAVGLLTISGSTFCVVIIKFTGKRKLMLFSVFGTSIINFLMGLYAYQNLPLTVNSYDESTFPSEYSNVPLIYLCSLVFVTCMGLSPLPWVFLSELFPFKSRSTVCGLAAAIFYLFSFVSTKSFIDIQRSIGIFGAFWLYSAIALLGVIYLYFYLPETENKTLEEIEREFSGEREKIQANDFLTALLVRQNHNTNEF